MPWKSSPTVALLLTTDMHYTRELLHGVFEYVHQHRPWRYVTGWEPMNWSAEGGVALQGGLGIFVAGRTLEEFTRRGVPHVNVSEKQSGVGMARVLPDNEAAGRMAAEYFLEKKFANFAFCGNGDFAFSRLRGKGFAERLAEEGHKCAVQDFGGGKWPAHSLDPLPELGEWLEELPKPCAVFAYADDHARRILGECVRVGLSVPEEVAVLGCDNDEFQCELAPLPVSSVAFPLRRIGYEAAAVLQGLMDGGEPPAEAVRFAPTGIVTRRSTDIIAVRDMAVARAVRYISAHAAEPIKVGDVVKACGASRRYLERRFMMLLGRTPKQEIQRKRLSTAKRLLAETLLPMPEVAEASGFSDAKLLSSVFRAEFGMAPSEFRREARSSRTRAADDKESPQGPGLRPHGSAKGSAPAAAPGKAPGRARG